MGARHVLVPVAFCVISVGPISVGGCGSSCNSTPLPQFQVEGSTYVHAGSSAEVSDADLGEVVATITARLPQSAYRCEAFTLHERQGTAAIGSEVRTIRDRSSALAARVGGAYARFDAR